MVYEKLSEAELDQFLLISYLPSRRDKVNFSDRDTFISMIVGRIIQLNIEEEFGENIEYFIRKEETKDRPIKCIFTRIFCMDMKRVKMAALKTYREFTDV